jgi:high-affinity nickel-transport protein
MNITIGKSQRQVGSSPSGTRTEISTRSRIILVYALIITATAGVWLWAWNVFSAYPLLLGTGFLAYTFGLRHAVDADHIAAIDNVTRKLMQDGKQPVNVGFFFSLGHSLVVIIAALGVALTAGAFKGKIDSFNDTAGVIGTCVSAGFLLLLGVLNLVVFLQVYRTFRQVKKTGVYSDEDLNLLLSKRGFMSRIFRSLFGMVNSSWLMFPIGFLFGLGFDTATEVAILGIAATQAGHGVSMWSVMVFPALFTVGMTLVDTTDGVLMLGAYRWAFVTPMRKLFYNMTITAVSVVVALVIGGIEALGLLGDQFAFKGTFWAVMDNLNDNFNTIGFWIIGIFLSAWLLSVLIYRFNRYDDILVETEQPTA